MHYLWLTCFLQNSLAIADQLHWFNKITIKTTKVTICVGGDSGEHRADCIHDALDQLPVVLSLCLGHTNTTIYIKFFVSTTNHVYHQSFGHPPLQATLLYVYNIYSHSHLLIMRTLRWKIMRTLRWKYNSGFLCYI